MSLGSWVTNAWINVLMDCSASTAPVHVLVLMARHAILPMERVIVLQVGQELTALKESAPTEVLAITAIKTVSVKWKTPNCAIRMMENATANQAGVVQRVIDPVHSLSSAKIVFHNATAKTTLNVHRLTEFVNARQVKFASPPQDLILNCFFFKDTPATSAKKNVPTELTAKTALNAVAAKTMPSAILKLVNVSANQDGKVSNVIDPATSTPTVTLVRALAIVLIVAAVTP